MKFSRLFVPVAVALSLGACSLESVLDDLAADIQAAKLQQVIDDAKANGGDAVVFKAADGADLSIAEGPIAGARVVIPPNALPAGVAEAVLAISHNAGYAVPGTEQVGAGPAVQVTLQSVPSLEPIAELITDATVTVPYGDAVSTETDEANVALGHDVGGTLHVVDGDTDVEAGTTSGPTKTFSPFLAVLPAPAVDETPVEPVYVFTFAVTDAAGTVCEGQLEAADVTVVFESVLESMYVTDSIMTLSLTPSQGPSMTLKSASNPQYPLINGDLAVTDVTWNASVANCGEFGLDFQLLDISGTVANWNETGVDVVSDCSVAGDGACDRHLGFADVQVQVGPTQGDAATWLTLSVDAEAMASVEMRNDL